MANSAIPSNENLRLDVLHSLQVLDTPIEERFDRITRMVARVFDMPMSGISFVDDKRHWLKSVQGSEVVEIPREYSFCSHTILDDEVLVVSDAREDPRFADNPLLKVGKGVRFYAGAPLIIAENIRVGALCLCDVKPRDFNDANQALLKDFSITVVNELIARMNLDYRKITG